jgi:hypothetical protein
VINQSRTKKSLLQKATLTRNKKLSLGSARRLAFKKRRLKVISRARIIAGARKPRIFRRIQSALTRLRAKK